MRVPGGVLVLVAPLARVAVVVVVVLVPLLARVAVLVLVALLPVVVVVAVVLAAELDTGGGVDDRAVEAAGLDGALQPVLQPRSADDQRVRLRERAQLGGVRLTA